MEVGLKAKPKPVSALELGKRYDAERCAARKAAFLESAKSTKPMDVKSSRLPSAAPPPSTPAPAPMPPSAPAAPYTRAPAPGVGVEETLLKARITKSEQPWTIRPGQEYKSKIVGKAQKTGGRTRETQTGEHATRVYREAIKAAKREDVEKVFLNRGYKKATGESVAPNRRPDVISVKKDRKVDAVEVRSRTDDPEILRLRNEEVMQQLPPEMQGEIDVIKPTEIKDPIL